jgi:hypothetical protein
VASWLRYDADYAKFSNPEPLDTYDGADQDTNQWVVRDDGVDIADEAGQSAIVNVPGVSSGSVGLPVGLRRV